MDKYCRGCVYYSSESQYVACCNYIFKVGKKRPCDPGKDCTVKVIKKKKEKKNGGQDGKA